MTTLQQNSINMPSIQAQVLKNLPEGFEITSKFNDDLSLTFTTRKVKGLGGKRFGQIIAKALPEFTVEVEVKEVVIDSQDVRIEGHEDEGLVRIITIDLIATIKNIDTKPAKETKDRVLKYTYPEDCVTPIARKLYRRSQRTAAKKALKALETPAIEVAETVEVVEAVTEPVAKTKKSATKKAK